MIQREENTFYTKYFHNYDNQPPHLAKSTISIYSVKLIMWWGDSSKKHCSEWSFFINPRQTLLNPTIIYTGKTFYK